MIDKFKNIPNDPDTNILTSFETKFNDLDCVFQTWLYDGIKGNSIILYKYDIENYTKEIIEEQIRQSDLMKDNNESITYSSSQDHDYCFFNFNFE